MSCPLLLVVGMHRSGTSLLGALLHGLGVNFPGEKIRADLYNPEGYFEWRQIVDLQERLLIDLDRWWPSYKGSLPMPSDWLGSSASQIAKAQIISLLSTALDRNNISAIKDPRTSRLIPLWLLIAKELSIPLKIILSVRDPSEVSCSLVTRDYNVTGMNLVRAQQIWYRHNIEVIEELPESIPIIPIDFGKWFTNPERQLSGLLKSLPELKPDSQQEKYALSLIRSDLRRSFVDRSPMRRSTNNLYAQLISDEFSRNKICSLEVGPSFFDFDSSSPPSQSFLKNSPDCWSQLLYKWRHHPAPRCVDEISVKDVSSLRIFGSNLCNYLAHIWIDKLPMHLAGLSLPSIEHNSDSLIFSSQDCVSTPEARTYRIGLNVDFPVLENRILWLSELQEYDLIFDPEPSRVYLLRALGLAAFWLDLSVTSNGWLEQQGAVDLSFWALHLGLALPELDHLIVLGRVGEDWDKELTEESHAQDQLEKFPISYIPGWFEIVTKNSEAALARAGWLHYASTNSFKLIWVNEPRRALSEPILNSVNLYSSNSITVDPGLTPSQLRTELIGKKFCALVEDRPSPLTEEIYSWETGQQPTVSILVSLFDYEQFVLEALESIASQTQANLELIVVDDCSTDSGLEIVKAWMLETVLKEYHPFVRLRLLLHTKNTGLSAARNTAFKNAISDWCFVLDADNYLLKDAVRACLSCTSQASDSLAVVHPLIRVESDLNRPDDVRSLVGGASWQREHFVEGNFIDAMALIRRSAWQAVAGYTHIEGGWEDYDFWCKLIELGFYGVQCPHIGAIYRSHSISMSNLQTNSSWQPLKVSLQDRHDWLSFPAS